MGNITCSDDQDIDRLVRKLASHLERAGWTMATAESCTGGWIAKFCTDLAGSSAWFDCGFVSGAGFEEAYLEDLACVVPFIDGAVDIEAFVTLEANQPGAQHIGEHPGDFRFAHARFPF